MQLPTKKSLFTLLNTLFSLIQNPPALALQLIEMFMQRVGSQLVERTGEYEALKLDIHLQLCDSKGAHAVYSKAERVRFLQDNVIAYQDQAWGDGDIFVDYQCSPGVAVDHYREGHRYRILISLRQTKNRGEILDLFVKRKIRNGFTRKIEELQMELDHVTREACLRVTFPKDRPPKRMWGIAQNDKRTIELQPLQQQPDGQWQIQWEIEKPKRYEAYLIRWEW